LLLAVDVGNTEVSFGAFDGDRLRRAWRIRTDTTRTPDEYGASLTTMMESGDCHITEVDAVLIASVVPGLNRVFQEACEKYIGMEPRFVTPDMDTGIVLDVDHPHEVGADRVVNSVAVERLYGSPSIVVDFGTATTFDVVDVGGRYIGGAILPGIQISMEALFGRTALLSRVELRPRPQIIGRNTAAMLQSGFYHGFLGQMEHVLEGMRRELGAKPRVIATGGLAEPMARDSDYVDVVEPHLTLTGLRILHERLR